MPAIDELLLERRRQDVKWGEQNHDATVWAAVLGEEYGEFCEAVLERRVAIADPARALRKYVESGLEPREEWLAEMRKEAIQIGAVAVAIVEWIDRGCPIDSTDLGGS